MRVATLGDHGAIFEMSMAFMSSTGYAPFADEDSISNVITNILTAEPNEKIILIEEGKGFLAGAAAPFIFGKHLLATEIAWYVVPEERGSKLGSEFLEAFEYWAKNVAGCTMLSMGCLDKKLEKYYVKKGYKLYERAYMKVF